MYAKYTEYLKNIMDSPFTRPDLEAALSTYPLYSSKKTIDLIPNRSELNERILNHYKYREIGSETVGRFLDELKTTMHEIMPRYNELFKTIEIMHDLPSPFDNVDVVETFEQERISKDTSSEQFQNTGNESSNTSSEGSDNKHSKNIYADAPGSQINYPTKNISDVEYATNASWDHDLNESKNKIDHTGNTSNSGTASNERSGNDRTTHTYTKKGNQGVNTYAHDMIEFRESIINVVDQIIHDERLNRLFMVVY